MAETAGITLEPKHAEIVRGILQRWVPASEVWAFGSRARGDAKPWSDLDLVVLASEPLDWSVSAALADAFEASDLPWRVDVIDWATTADSFRRIIERDRIVLQRAA